MPRRKGAAPLGVFRCEVQRHSEPATVPVRADAVQKGHLERIRPFFPLLTQPFVSTTRLPSSQFTSIAMRYTSLSLTVLATTLLCFFSASTANGEPRFTALPLKPIAR